MPILEVHKMSVAEVRQELEAEGYRLTAVLDDLPWQHILVLTLADGTLTREEAATRSR